MSPKPFLVFFLSVRKSTGCEVFGAFLPRFLEVLLGGSRVVVIGVISRVTIVITRMMGIYKLTHKPSTHEPPSGSKP